MSITTTAVSLIINYSGINTTSIILNEYQLAKIGHFNNIKLLNVGERYDSSLCGNNQTDVKYYLFAETSAHVTTKRCIEERPPADCPNIALTPILDGVHISVISNTNALYSEETLRACAFYTIGSGELYV